MFYWKYCKIDSILILEKNDANNKHEYISFTFFVFIFLMNAQQELWRILYISMVYLQNGENEYVRLK